MDIQDAGSDTVAEKNILYDLLHPVEWAETSTFLTTEKGVVYLWKSIASAVHGCLRFVADKLQHPLQLLGSSSSTPSAIVKLLNSRLPWQLAITSDGTVLAVLKDSKIEVRTLLDGFKKARVSIDVVEDPKPSWRQILWNSNGTLLAWAASSGLVQIFSSSGTLLGEMGGVASEDPASVGVATVASMTFLPCPQGKDGSDGRSSDVLSLLCVLLFNGNLKTYEVRVSEVVNLHTFSLGSYFPEGVSCLLYHHTHHMLLVGGTPYTQDPLGAPCGLSGWRLLDDAPHWGPRLGQSIQKAKRGYFSRLIPRKRDSRQHSGMIFDMSLNPSGTLVAAIDVSGNLSLWEVPGFKRREFWQSKLLPMKAKSTEEDNKKDSQPIQVSWWSDEALILANELGEVYIFSSHSLSNLLNGGHVTGWSITPAINEQFFLLECDVKHETVIQRSRVPSLSHDDPGKDAEDGGEEDESFSLSRFSTNLVKQVLFFITDSEKFRTNTKKKYRVIKRQYRVGCIKAVTPEDCYERKLQSEEYDEALELAREYELDCDRVYQRQWQSYDVSVATIQDYLSKISKRSWVLHECLNRHTVNGDTMRSLLKYGLTRTSLRELLNLGGEILSGPVEELEGEEELETALRELGKLVKLTPDQVSLCQFRHMLLCYLDRLSTFEAILEGPTGAERVFECGEYAVFRSDNLVQSAISFARDSDWGALETLFTYHGAVLLPHRLAILFNFPETTPPKLYRTLLPAVSPKGRQLVSWKQKSHRSPDWVEHDIVRRLCSLSDEVTSNPADSVYGETPEWVDYMDASSLDVISSWYITRATEIEEFSGQVDCALQLIELGMDKGVKGLDECYHELKTLSTLVYECNVDSRLNLKKFKALSSLEVIELMMKEEEQIVTEADSGFIRGLETWVVPFLERLEAVGTGRSKGLLKQYLTQLSKNGLEPCLLVLQQSNAASESGDGYTPLVATTRDKIELAISCIYASDRSDQLDVSDQIVECLPSRTYRSDDPNSSLHDQVDRLENIISAAEIFMSYGIKKPIRFIRDMQGSAEESQQILVMLTRVASRKQPPMSKESWQDLLEHLLLLQDTLFSLVEEVTCYKIYTESLLCSGEQSNIQLASNHLTLSPHHETTPTAANVLTTEQGSQFKLSYSLSVQLVVGAAKEYFNSASSLMDSEMDLARSCLGLFSIPGPEVQRELNLIASLSLLDDFHVSMLPVQVRLCENKLDVVRAVLDSSPTAYRMHDKILHLCKLLDDEQHQDSVPSSVLLRQDSAEGQVVLSQDQGHSLILVVLNAIQAKDYKLAVQLSSQLMKMQFSPAWEVWRLMGLDSQVGDYNTRLRLLNFSISHCPPEEIASLLQSKRLVQLQADCESCGVGRDTPTSTGGSGPQRGAIGGRQSLMGSLVSKGTGAVQQLIRSRQPTTDQKHSAATEDVMLAASLQGLRTLTASPAALEGEAAGGTQTRAIKLIYHPFFNRDDKSMFVYGDFRKKSTQRRVLVEQTLLRGIQMERGSSCSVENHDGEQRVLLNLAALCAFEDVHLTLGCLLSLGEAQYFDAWLSKVSSTKLSLEFVIYCICLHIYNTTGEGVVSPYQHPPSSFIQHVTSMVESPDRKEKGEGVEEWVELLAKYRQLLADCSQAEVLLKLGLGVDINEFTQDGDYRRSIILTLARSSDLKFFSTSISLARQHSVDEWEVYITLLDSVLTTGSSTVAEIERKIEERNILKSILSSPQKSVDYLMKHTYPELPGCKYGVLLLYYSILRECTTKGAQIQEVTAIDVHVKLLSKLKSAIHGVDYKVLMSGTTDPLTLLLPALTTSNIHVLSKVVGKIPSTADTVLTPGMLFCAFSLKLFWQSSEKSQTKASKVNWIQRYDACLEYLSLLTASELHHFLQRVALCEKSLRLTVELRCELIEKTLTLCKKQVASKKTNAGKSTMTFEELAALLEGCYLKHLNHLSHPDLQEAMAPLSEDSWKRLMRKFDLSLSETEKVHSLVLEMISKGTPPHVVATVLNLAHSVHSHELSPASLYQEATSVALAAYNQADTDSTDKLELIMEGVSKYESTGGSVVTSSDLLKELKPYCSAPSTHPSRSRRLFTLIEKYLFLTEEDQQLLNYYQTQSILAKTKLPVEVSLSDVSDSNSQRKLFSSLLAMSTTSEEYFALSSLLHCWQTMGGVPLVECWVELLEKIPEREVAAEEAVLIRAGAESIPLEVDEKIFEYLCRDGTNVLGVLKYSLLCERDDMFKRAYQHLESNLSLFKCDEDLLELLLYRKKSLVLRKANSPLYTHLCSYLKGDTKAWLNTVLFSRLLHCSEEEVAEILSLNDRAKRVKEVAQQLFEGGFILESGALFVSGQSFHRELSTLNDSLAYASKIFKK